MFAKQDFIAHQGTMMLDQERDALQDIIARKQPFPLCPVLRELLAIQLGFLKSMIAIIAQLAWFVQAFH